MLVEARELREVVVPELVVLHHADEDPESVDLGRVPEDRPDNKVHPLNVPELSIVLHVRGEDALQSDVPREPLGVVLDIWESSGEVELDLAVPGICVRRVGGV
jgi:hypothetical protein